VRLLQENANQEVIFSPFLGLEMRPAAKTELLVLSILPRRFLVCVDHLAVIVPYQTRATSLKY
jgi:hypothetical protein